MIRRPPRSTRTDTLFPSRRSSDLVLGAGEMGEAMVLGLAKAGAGDIALANRTWDHAVDLADRVGGRAIRLLDVPGALADVDALLSSTGAASPLLEVDDLQEIVARGTGRPLLIVDLAVPRDIDPPIGHRTSPRRH